MTEKELEGNFLIAVFNGWIYKDLEDFRQDKSSTRIHCYHEDLDLLMLIINDTSKKLPIILEFSISLIPMCRLMYVPKNGEHKFFNSEQDNDITPIQTFFNVFVEFIKWYNNKISHGNN